MWNSQIHVRFLSPQTPYLSAQTTLIVPQIGMSPSTITFCRVTQSEKKILDVLRLTWLTTKIDPYCVLLTFNVTVVACRSGNSGNSGNAYSSGAHNTNSSFFCGSSYLKSNLFFLSSGFMRNCILICLLSTPFGVFTCLLILKLFYTIVSISP